MFLLQLVVGVAVLYALFWVLWLRRNMDAFRYLLNAKDKKWTPLVDPSLMIRGQLSADTVETKRTLVFVRHGESTWNITFNGSKAPHHFIGRLLQSAIFELSLIAKGVADSWFYDSPLSELGIEQADQLRTHLTHERNDPIINHLMTGKIRIVTSNLRRAISTALLAFRDRLKERSEKVTVLTSLQEVSNNPDSLSLLKPGTQPQVSWIEHECKQMNMHDGYSQHIDLTQYKGNKEIGVNGLKRIQAFNDWLFQQENEVVVAVGHSLWFRAYFQEFLPHNAVHEAKTKKIANGGAVAFDVKRVVLNGGKSSQEIVYCIDPKSIRNIYLGFSKG